MTIRKPKTALPSDGAAPSNNLRMLSVQQACDFTGLSESMIWKLMKAGQLAYTNVGRRRLIYQDSLQSLLREKAQPATGTKSERLTKSMVEQLPAASSSLWSSPGRLMFPDPWKEILASMKRATQSNAFAEFDLRSSSERAGP